MSDRRRAIVTGSESGIGRATAVALADAGCDVGVTWHVDEAGAEAAVPVHTTGVSFVVDGGMLLMSAMANQLARPDS